MTDTTLPMLERIARVLAGAELSANADGDDAATDMTSVHAGA